MQKLFSAAASFLSCGLEWRSTCIDSIYLLASPSAYSGGPHMTYTLSLTISEAGKFMISETDMKGMK